MEFVRSSDDCYAGYLQDDSDLEFSGCSDEVSSDEGEGGLVRSNQQCRVPAARGGKSGEWSEDEFEREMECELMGLLKTVASPDALAAAGSTSAASRDRSRVRAMKTRKEESSAVPQGTHDQSSSLPSSSLPRDEHVSGEKGEGEKEGGGGGGGGGGVSGEEQLDTAAAYYDKVYFESSSSGEDGEEEEQGDKTSKKKKKKKEERSGQRDQQCRKLTNEELFYDPHMDEEDEQWVKRQRLAYHNVQVSQQLRDEQRQRMTHTLPPQAGDDGETGRGGSEGGERGGGEREKSDILTPLRKSDAHLSCPACMTSVCIDCQQHSVYFNQFRAMFVMNCRIRRDEVLKHIPKPSKKERQRKRRKGRRCGGDEGVGGVGEEGEEGEEEYHPVHCAECNTEIAVYDKDEVFHFFNVLASAS